MDQLSPTQQAPQPQISRAITPKPKIASVDPWGVLMKVSFDHEAGMPQTWDDPGYAAEVYIDQVLVGGVDIAAMLTVDQHNRICEEVLRSLEA